MEPKWYQYHEATIPGYYFKCYVSNGVAYAQWLENLAQDKIDYIQANLDMYIDRYIYVYGPLQWPAPPIGATWGV